MDETDSCSCTLPEGAINDDIIGDGGRTEPASEAMSRYTAECTCSNVTAGSFKGSMRSERRPIDSEISSKHTTECTCTPFGGSVKGSMRSGRRGEPPSDLASRQTECTCTPITGGGSFKGSMRSDRRKPELESDVSSKYTGIECICTPIAGGSVKGKKIDSRRGESDSEASSKYVTGCTCTPTPGGGSIKAAKIEERKVESEASSKYTVAECICTPIPAESIKGSVKSERRHPEPDTEVSSRHTECTCTPLTAGSIKGSVKSERRHPEPDTEVSSRHTECTCTPLTEGSVKGSVKRRFDPDSEVASRHTAVESMHSPTIEGSVKGSAKRRFDPDSEVASRHTAAESMHSSAVGGSVKGSMKSEGRRPDSEIASRQTECTCTPITEGSVKGSVKRRFDPDSEVASRHTAPESMHSPVVGGSVKGGSMRRGEPESPIMGGSVKSGSARRGEPESDISSKITTAECTCTPTIAGSIKGSYKSDRRPDSEVASRHTTPESPYATGITGSIKGSYKSDRRPDSEVASRHTTPESPYNTGIGGSYKGSVRSDRKNLDPDSEITSKYTAECTCSIITGGEISIKDAMKGDDRRIPDVAITPKYECPCDIIIQGGRPKPPEPIPEIAFRSTPEHCVCFKPQLTGGPGLAPAQFQSIIDPNCDPNNPRMLTYDMIRAARKNVEGAVVKTPLTKSKLSEVYGMNIYLKSEFLQYTGSFKERGARHALMNMVPEQKRVGAVSASGGNHALAVCYHAQQLGIPITVVMPTTAAIMKIQNCKAFGADIIVKGNDLSEAKVIAQNLAREKGALYINGYDHIDVLAGQGTIGIEVLEQLPTASAVIVPTGGGGLIAGIAVAIKTLKPCTRVIGVESENCPSFSNSMKAGKPVATSTLSTVADGLAVPLPGYNSVFTAKSYVDKMIVVKEDDIAVAILRLIEKEKFVVEGAGATAIAAIASGQLDEFKGKNVVAILSGGNIDSTVLGRVLERGLAADGRFLKVYVTVSDRPGGVAELIKLISSIGVSIKFVTQERKWLIVDVFSVMVKVVCETRDWDHALELKHLLQDHYKTVNMVHVDFPPSTLIGKSET